MSALIDGTRVNVVDDISFSLRINICLVMLLRIIEIDQLCCLKSNF